MPSMVPQSGKEYNSNSAASTILNHVGIRIPDMMDFIPGFGNDLPVWGGGGGSGSGTGQDPGGGTGGGGGGGDDPPPIVWFPSPIDWWKTS